MKGQMGWKIVGILIGMGILFLFGLVAMKNLKVGGFLADIIERPSPEKTFAKAESLFFAGDYGAAIDEYEVFTKKYAGEKLASAAYIKIAESYRMSKGSCEQAQNAYDNFLTKYGNLVQKSDIDSRKNQCQLQDPSLICCKTWGTEQGMWYPDKCITEPSGGCVS